MSDKHLEEVVRAAVERALERQLPSLRESVVQDVLREVAAGPASKSGTSPQELQKAVATIQAGTNQKEILRALLESTVLGSGRAALFVVKGGSATGWQGAGFASNESIKDSSFDLHSGLAAAAMESRSAESGSVSEVDETFISKVGAPPDGKAVVLPLLLRDKVSALVYADAGAEGNFLDAAALDVLVRATSAWLEVISQRKQTLKEGSAEAPESSHATPSNDPFAAHAPLHTAKAQHSSSEVAPELAMAAAAAGSAPPRSVAGVTNAPATPPSSPQANGAPAHSGPANEDTEVHRKAHRFARLLMDEIKLYNQAKVAEGRKHKDLYDRLREDIEKSRATYQKRYGNTAAGSADYFNQELIRSLAEDDVSNLGSNFRR